ncbi:MAG: DUF4199 family protein [Saprospiraceae bacterium]
MKKNILIFGFLNGILSFAMTIYSLKNSQFTMEVALAAILISIFAAILAAFFYRRTHPQDASFRSLLLVVMGGLMLGYCLSVIANIIYISSLSEETKLMLENKFIENQFRRFETIANSIKLQEEMEKSADNLFNISQQLAAIPVFFIFNGIVSALVALCLKRE